MQKGFQPIFFHQSACLPCAGTCSPQGSSAISSNFCYCFRIWFVGSKEEEMDFTADSFREVTSSSDGKERAMSFPAGQERVKRMAW